MFLKSRPSLAICALFVAALLTIGLGACGKRGAPVPPEGKPVIYPKTYPTQ